MTKLHIAVLRLVNKSYNVLIKQRAEEIMWKRLFTIELSRCESFTKHKRHLMDLACIFILIMIMLYSMLVNVLQCK